LEKELKEVFYDIITGKVKRSLHQLTYQEKDYTNLFIFCLKEKAYFAVPLKSVDLEVGTRIPGFFLDDKTAYFGYLFWEVFDDRHKRKIWGSVVRNKKGDWKYILPGNSSKEVYLNTKKVQEIDIFHLT
jgi:hypothetical protein